MSEAQKLDFTRVRSRDDSNVGYGVQEVAFTHMYIVEGVATLLQLSGLLSRLCAAVK